MGLLAQQCVGGPFLCLHQPSVVCMPYSTVSDHDECDERQVAVVKDSDGKLMGCHDSEDDAQDQIAALEASESDRSMDDLPAEIRDAYESGEPVERSYAGVVERGESEGDDGPIVMRFNRGSTTDAHGTRFDMDGADLERYQSNPIVRWAHGKDTHGRVPIGRADVSVQGDDLVAQVRFDQEDEFARKIESKVRRGFVNAGSIHAAPTAPPEMRSVDDSEVVAFPEWELRGLSVVGIPSNPDATAISRDDERSDLEKRLERLERMLVNGEDVGGNTEERAVSVDEVSAAIRSEVFDMDGPSESWFVRDVTIDSVGDGTAEGTVVAFERESDQAFRMAFSYDAGDVTLADRDDWTEVTETWVPVDNMDRMIEQKRSLVGDDEPTPLTRNEAIRAATIAVAQFYARRRKKKKQQKKEFRQSLKRELGKA